MMAHPFPSPLLGTGLSLLLCPGPEPAGHQENPAVYPAVLASGFWPWPSHYGAFFWPTVFWFLPLCKSRLPDSPEMHGS